jgi:hypothetical protein
VCTSAAGLIACFQQARIQGSEWRSPLLQNKLKVKSLKLEKIFEIDREFCETPGAPPLIYPHPGSVTGSNYL